MKKINISEINNLNELINAIDKKLINCESLDIRIDQNVLVKLLEKCDINKSYCLMFSENELNITSVLKHLNKCFEEKNQIGCLHEIVNARILDLIDSKEQAENESRAKADFLASMNHEIRSPLHAILGVTNLLSETSLDDKQRNYLDLIRKAGDTLLETISDVLDLSKIEAGKLTLNPTNFSLYTAIENVVDIISINAKEKDIEFLIDLDPNLKEFYVGDIIRIKQILLNLLTNAVKFTDHGYVLLKVSAKRVCEYIDEICFEVHDTGIGIPQDKLSSIFDRFSQADASINKRFGGTGLGLAICKSLISLMDGQIGVKSEEGKGSIFHFNITLQVGKHEKKKAMNIPAVNLKGLRALVVDDIEVNRNIISQYIKNWGITPLTCNNGLEALEILIKEYSEGRKIDLILLDYEMPVMNGIECAKEIRKDNKLRNIPIMMVTASPPKDAANPEELLKLGFLGLVVKPYYPDNLRHKICLVLQAAKSNNYNKLISATTLLEYKEYEPQQIVANDARFKGFKVLVAEDLKVNMMLITRILDKYGCIVTETFNGIEAVEAAKKANYDIMFIDCHMPKMDGYEAVKQIREIEKIYGRKPTPIIAITADAVKDNENKCLSIGMNDYLSKPFKESQFVAMIEKYMSNKTN
ncbi:MAG: PAS:Response regulator receiver:GAF:ATP-binding region, ATPase-like:Histidine kinase A-like protein [Rickettsiaceae bacterium]|jgi:signal transduction histidine kinase/DNA-binding response OmpR family regulator|nr:PAS:Response regulator receiver:GAF:ATP-binding region, ATPase-like:Histidine kinase A-like protein [Rickettsiaceae bacterium]